MKRVSRQFVPFSCKHLPKWHAMQRLSWQRSVWTMSVCRSNFAFHSLTIQQPSIWCQKSLIPMQVFGLYKSALTTNTTWRDRPSLLQMTAPCPQETTPQIQWRLVGHKFPEWLSNPPDKRDLLAPFLEFYHCKNSTRKPDEDRGTLGWRDTLGPTKTTKTGADRSCADQLPILPKCRAPHQRGRQVHVTHPTCCLTRQVAGVVILPSSLTLLGTCISSGYSQSFSESCTTTGQSFFVWHFS